MTASEPEEPSVLVLPLDQDAATDPRSTGGKGAALARMTAAGLTVPDGFCVSGEVFRRLVGADLRERIANLPSQPPVDAAAARQLREAAAEVQRLIASRTLPDDAAAAIRDAYAAMGAPAVAVRSSATAEDLPQASAAGQHDSYLNVEGEQALLDTAVACMASLFTERAVAYRARNGIPHVTAAMAVVVQRMVDASAAGVLFTADPLTGDRRTSVIDATPGLGEGLVSGAVAVDRARVDDRHRGEVSYQVGDKAAATRASSRGGTETVALEPSRRRRRALTDEQVLALVRTGRDIERLLSGPQDIEWAWAGQRLHVLQARPIASLFPVPEAASADAGVHVYLSVGHMQAFAEAMPPLATDFFDCFARSAWSGRGPTLAAAGGRLYLDITGGLRPGRRRRWLLSWLFALSEQAGVALDDIVARRGDEIAMQRTSREPGRRLTAALAVLPWAPSMVGRLIAAFAGLQGRPAKEEAWYDAYGLRLAAEARWPADLRGRVHRTLRPMTLRRIAELYARIVPLFAALAAPALLQRLVPDAEEAVNAIGGGFPSDIITRINLGLGDLADVARHHPAVRETLLGGGGLDAVAKVEGGHVFSRRFAAFQDEFGHRATGEIDLSRPRWREDPSGLLAAIRTNLTNTAPGGHRDHLRRITEEAEQAAGALERQARRLPLGRPRAALVRRLVRVHRGWIWVREHPKHGLAHAFAAWRGVLLEAGAALATAAALPSEDDVWLLRADELLGMLDREEMAVDLRARRAELAHHRQLQAPVLITSDGEIPTASTQRELPDDALAGTPVSAGVVEGTARVVRDPAAEGLEPGEILIAPSIDPGWTPLFLNAAGLVTEVGSRFSHGAIVAREYRLPAIVAATGATTRIQTGDRVRLDGTQGTVEVLS